MTGRCGAVGQGGADGRWLCLLAGAVLLAGGCDSLGELLK
jgi:hypothetical protein